MSNRGQASRWIVLLVGLFWLVSLPGAAQDLPCCDPAAEPELSGQQSCATGHSCCGNGDWRCNDSLGIATCVDPGPICEPRCCDPTEQPGQFGNPPCVEGTTCCSTGDWQCNDATGSSTCVAESETCPLACCDPLEQPGQFGNPFCVEGATCCSTGEWQCNDAGAQSTCSIDSAVCQDCCDPSEMPGLPGNPICIEGATCCGNGEWQCNDGAAMSTCQVDGIACPRQCCDPADRPGLPGNPICVEGATCCGGGEWVCNDASGVSTCAVDGDECQPQCCDPFEEPGQFGNPFCFEGATCCETGEWQCNDAGANSTCDVDGEACEVCCDPFEEPGRFGNPFCFEGATCCETGEWQCNDAGADSTCDSDGLVCEDCCDLADEPGQFGNPPCVEGATCCSSGDWQCNDAGANSTCDLDGMACEPRCCDPALQPDLAGNPQCANGFQCCADGQWRCNDAAGLAACPVNDNDECVQICGGIAGLPCDDGEFCRFAPGECCCDFFGVCTPIPEQCPLIYDPVCGCDGQTYGNECEAGLAGVSVEHPGPCEQICGGIAGIECDPGEFCNLPLGQCCCDVLGNCLPIPDACPAVCDPVCGCDGTTYGNRCEAAAAGASIDHGGPCFSGGGLVERVRFDELGNIGWQETAGALGYNVYKKIVGNAPPQNFGDCIASGLLEPHAPVPGLPASGRLWLLQVTAIFDSGEGPMGTGSQCGVRRPAAPCSCSLPADVGPCDGTFPRWFHNFLTGQCEEFVWGGCGGNANNFETLEACQASCVDACTLPADVGPCDGIFPRWFHNAETGQCEEFIWGGCGGNANNFESEAACLADCVCSLPPDVGPCDGIFPRWFHNANTQQCEEFVWGGCDGNANNFDSRAECRQACDCDASSVDPCIAGTP